MNSKEKILELKQSGLDITGIATELNKQGIKTPTGLKWSYQNVFSVLRRAKPSKAKRAMTPHTVIAEMDVPATFRHNREAAACIAGVMQLLRNTEIPGDRLANAIDALTKDLI